MADQELRLEDFTQVGRSRVGLVDSSIRLWRAWAPSGALCAHNCSVVWVITQEYLSCPKLSFYRWRRLCDVERRMVHCNRHYCWTFGFPAGQIHTSPSLSSPLQKVWKTVSYSSVYSWICLKNYNYRYDEWVWSDAMLRQTTENCAKVERENCLFKQTR